MALAIRACVHRAIRSVGVVAGINGLLGLWLMVPLCSEPRSSLEGAGCRLPEVEATRVASRSAPEWRGRVIITPSRFDDVAGRTPTLIDSGHVHGGSTHEIDAHIVRGKLRREGEGMFG